MSIAETIRNLRKSGRSIDEIYDCLDYPRHEILNICREAGMGVTDDEKSRTRSSVNKSFTHDEDWVVEYISNKSNGSFIYVSGYMNMDSHVLVKCIKNGHEIDKSMISFRSGSKIMCPICMRLEIDERKKKKQQQIARDKLIREFESERRKYIKAVGKQKSFIFCECGNIMSSNSQRCSYCVKKAERKRREIKRRHKISAVCIDNDITLEKLYQRDDGKCYLCGCICDWNDKTETDRAVICGNYYPSIDHVIPLSKGGTHSWNNVKLAHRICNSLKKDDIIDQSEMEKQNSESYDRGGDLSEAI